MRSLSQLPPTGAAGGVAAGGVAAGSVAGAWSVRYGVLLLVLAGALYYYGLRSLPN